MDPLFITEGSFVVLVLKSSSYKTGFNVKARVQFKLHEKDRGLVQSVQ